MNLSQTDVAFVWKKQTLCHGSGSTLPESYLWANVRFPLDEFRSSICRTSTTCHELITQTSLRENKCNDHQSYSEQCICLYTFVWTCLYTFGFAHNPKSISFKLWSSSISKFSYKEKLRLSTRHTWPWFLSCVTFTQPFNPVDGWLYRFEVPVSVSLAVHVSHRWHNLPEKHPSLLLR